MMRTVRSLGFILVLLLAGPSAGQYQVGDVVADFTLPGLDGQDHSLSELRGRVVLLNFFATWCQGCNEEATHLQQDIWEPYAARGVTVVSVDVQEQAVLVDGWRQALQVDYPIWLAPDWSLFQTFTMIGGLPYNTVIDPDGVLRYSQTGFDLLALLGVLEDVLAVATPSEEAAWSTVKRLYR